MDTVALARCFERRVSRAVSTAYIQETVGNGWCLLCASCHLAEAKVLMRPDLLTATVRSHYVQLPRKHNEIGVRSDEKATFRFETDRACGIFRRHRDGFIQRNVHLAHHHAHKVDHARGAAREG